MKLYSQTVALLVVFLMAFSAGCGPKEDAPVVASNPPQETIDQLVNEKEASQAKASPALAEPESIPQSSQEEPTLSDDPNSDASADSKTVNHQDPTSYPITKLDAKVDGQWVMLSWNVESDGAEGEVVAKELTALNADDRYDVVALTEVKPQDLKIFRLALGIHYKYAFSKSGGSDKMQILYNENKFEKIRHNELKDINIKNRYRAPLVVHLKEKSTNTEFLVMVNHLARGKPEIRQQQASMLVEWARNETMPIVGLGDYNFDYVFSTEKGNPAFVNFMRDNIYRWVKPTDLVDTNWYDDPREADGKDDYPGSMLDFAFVAGSAKDWKSTCTVIVRKDDFPDGDKRSDHRPFELVIEK